MIYTTTTTTTTSSSNAPIHTRSISRCLKIGAEERRFAQFEVEQSRILKEIMQKTNTKIEVTATKDGSLNFCVFGRDQNINAAIELILNDFQTPVTLTVSVPKTIHGRLLGPKGVRLASIQEETQTKIAMPRKDDDSDVVRVVGLKANAERAVASIQKYVKEFAEKTVERINVEKIYLLFITGAFNENLRRWESTGVKVSTNGSFLSNHNNNNNNNNTNSNNNSNSSNYHQNDNGRSPDEVTFILTGEMQAVANVKQEIQQIYDDKKKKCTTVNIEVKKAQHKYILGQGGQNLRGLFAKTGVSVELPTERESETITLRGELTKLGPALSELYSQAHSEMDAFIDAENWIHKYLIGARKTNNIDFKARNVFVRSMDDKIKLHGPPAEVEDIRDILEKELESIKKNIIRKDIRVEPRIHGCIIGKQGSTVEQIRVESGAYILVPSADESSNEFITLEGTLEAVTLAEEKINAIAKKYEASKKLAINQQLQGSIIGKGGEKIREIREKFSQVVFTFPEQGSNCNEVTISGPNEEVEACYNYLSEFHKQLLETNHQAQLPIRNDVIKHISDAQQAIKRIKQEHKVKVDIHINNNEVKNGALKKEINISELNQSATNENKLVTENSNAIGSDKANTKQTSKGGKASKKQQQNSNSKDNQPSQQQQQPLKENNNVTRARRTSGSAKEAKTVNNNLANGLTNYAIVTGRKEDVEAAKTKLVKLFDELSTSAEFELRMPQKLYNQDKLQRQLLDEFHHKVVINFISSETRAKQQAAANQSNPPKTAGDGEKQVSQSNVVSAGANNKENKQLGNKSDQYITVKIRGPSNIAKKVVKRFETLMSENYQAVVSVPNSIMDKFLPTDRTKIMKLKEAHNVKIILPDKKGSLRTIKIVGAEKSVQTALQQFNNLIQTVDERIEEKIDIDSQCHPRLIGAGGKSVRKIMDEFKVEVKFASQDDPEPNVVTLYGKASNVEAAKNHMIKLAQTINNQLLVSSSTHKKE